MKRLFIIAVLFVSVLCAGSRCEPDHDKIYSSQLSVQNPATMVVSGELEVTFELSNPGGRRSGVGILFSTDAGSTWSSATIKSASAGDLQGNLIRDLLAPRVAATYTFVWDTVTDVRGIYFTPPPTTSCGLIKVVNGAGIT